MRGRVRGFFSHRVARNAMILYGVQGCNYMLPILVLPYLARVLGPARWGMVVLAQALAGYVGLVVEYGFDLSATREASCAVGDRARLRELIAAVTGAKLVLAGAAVAVAAVAWSFLGQLHHSPELFWCAILIGLAQGGNMLWYYQGLQRMGLAGGLEVGGKVLAAAGVFLLVRSPEDGWKVLAAQAAAVTLSTTAGSLLAVREVGVSMPTPASTRRVLRSSWSMFIFRGSSSLLTTANIFVLGLLATPVAVGIFAAAEKVNRAVSAMLWPVNQALFPYLSQNARSARGETARTVRWSLGLMGAAGVVIGAAIFAAAPAIVRIAFGQQFLPAIGTLRIFAVMVPLATVNWVLTFQWALPLGEDKLVGRLVLITGIFNIALAAALAPAFTHLGVAAAIVCAQLVFLAALLEILRRKALLPWHRTAPVVLAQGQELLVVD